MLHALFGLFRVLLGFLAMFGGVSFAVWFATRPSLPAPKPTPLLPPPKPAKAVSIDGPYR